VSFIEDIKKKYEYYFTYDKPIPFKNLLIYPVLMSEYFEFFNYINCLTIEKNNIPNAKIIGMSYLEFLYRIKDEKNDSDIMTCGEMLTNIIRICFNVDPDTFRMYSDNEGKVTLKINNEEINKKEFDTLKRIICYQNSPDYDDAYIDPTLKQALDDANNLRNRDKSAGSTSLERQILCVISGTPFKVEDIMNMTIRKFLLLLEIVNSKVDYLVYKSGECSGNVTFKNPIMHWMYHKDTKFDTLVNYDSFKQKVNNAN